MPNGWPKSRSRTAFKSERRGHLLCLASKSAVPKMHSVKKTVREGETKAKLEKHMTATLLLLADAGGRVKKTHFASKRLPWAPKPRIGSSQKFGSCNAMWLETEDSKRESNAVEPRYHYHIFLDQTKLIFVCITANLTHLRIIFRKFTKKVTFFTKSL